MGDSNSLLSFVAPRYTRDLEDVATDALSFILSRSTSAKRALSEFLEDDRGPLPIAKAQPREVVTHGAEPDLACIDEDGKRVAFVEAKFWAELTAHQPVTYWQELTSDRPAVLLFLAPESRIVRGPLWGDLVGRLQEAGHELGPADRRKNLVTASAKADQRRLMLASWHFLLDSMAERTKREGDTQAHFEIAELQGLTGVAIKGDNPQRDENLRKLIAEAVKRLKQSGWANTDRLQTGEGREYFARYLRLAGASAGLRIDYEVKKKMPDKPLWLWFYGDPADSVGIDAVRSTLGSEAEPGLEWYPGDVCIPIPLPVDADNEATLDSIVGELERIAELIDPNGPTYKGSTPIAGGS